MGKPCLGIPAQAAERICATFNSPLRTIIPTKFSSMAQVKVPSDLHVLVKTKYDAAIASVSVVFSDTKLAVIHANGIPFQLRYCPALSGKPKSTLSDRPEKPFDPFDNPPQELLVTELTPAHLLVLNKYPVIPEHFILATKEFKEQTHLLDKEDLSVAHACVKAWKNQGTQLFCFFNSGENSGASQRHRHLQFLDTGQMKDGRESEGWEVLADRVIDVLAGTTTENSGSWTLPFLVFPAMLPEDPSPDNLHEIYIALYKKAVSAVRSYFPENPWTKLDLHVKEDGPSAISYNLGITHKGMILCPRRREHGTRDKSINDVTLERPALNGTVLAGTLMVKSEEAYESMKEDPGQLIEVLKDIGFPPLDELQTKL